MRTPGRCGGTLPELMLAILVLAGLALATGPVTARTGMILRQARVRYEGLAIAARHLATARWVTPVPCATAWVGADSGRLARVRWTTSPATGAVNLIFTFEDRGWSQPAETLATMLPCGP